MDKQQLNALLAKLYEDLRQAHIRTAQIEGRIMMVQEILGAEDDAGAEELP